MIWLCLPQFKVSVLNKKAVILNALHIPHGSLPCMSLRWNTSYRNLALILLIECMSNKAIDNVQWLCSITSILMWNDCFCSLHPAQMVWYKQLKINRKKVESRSRLSNEKESFFWQTRTDFEFRMQKNVNDWLVQFYRLQWLIGYTWRATWVARAWIRSCLPIYYGLFFSWFWCRRNTVLIDKKLLIVFTHISW